jgi:hypothetical protein
VTHRVGDRVKCVTCPSGPWFGRVLAVECLVCSEQLVDDKCPKGHDVGKFRAYDGTERMAYSVTIAQDRVPDDRRPWERLLADRLVPEG